jgi:chloramphenicol O-acetyltransferase type A
VPSHALPPADAARRRVLEDYPRRAHLEFFRRYPSPFYTVSFELDATRLRAGLAERGASVYAGFVWAIHRALVEIPAFRTRLEGEEVVLYETLRVGLTVPAPGKTFSFATPSWDPDPDRFLPAAELEMTRASSSIDLSGGAAPDFAYYTALPKVPFTHFSHVPLPDPTAGQPEIAFGKFAERGGRLLVPLGIQVNHLYVDGADLGELHERAAESFARAL